MPFNYDSPYIYLPPFYYNFELTKCTFPLHYGPNGKWQQDLMKMPGSIKGLSQLIYLITTNVLFFSLPMYILILDQAKLMLVP